MNGQGCDGNTVLWERSLGDGRGKECRRWGLKKMMSQVKKGKRTTHTVEQIIDCRNVHNWRGSWRLQDGLGCDCPGMLLPKSYTGALWAGDGSWGACSL